MEGGSPLTARRRPDLLALLLLAVALLLPAIAVMQLRWLDRLGAAELDRMRRMVGAGGFLVSESIDRQVAAVFSTFAVDAGGTADPEADRLLADRLTERLASWRLGSAEPRLVAAVQLLRRSPDGRDRWTAVPDPHRPGGTPCGRPPEPDASQPPAELPAGRDTAAGGLACGASQGAPPRLFIPLGGEPWAAPTSPPPAGPPPAGPPTAWAVVTLDRGYLLDCMLPRLIERYFSLPDGSAFGRGEAAVGDLQIALRPLAPAADSPPAPALAIYPPGGSPPDPAPAEMCFHLLSLRIRDWLAPGGGGAPAVTRQPRDQPGCWQLEVTHRAGSLEAAVAGMRRQQMAGSFGVLALLGLAAGSMAVAARRAARLGRQQIAFVAGVSHELRTPLTAIRSAGDNLAEGVVAAPDRVSEYGRLIRSEGRRLSEMVENVLRFGRLSSGPPSVARRPVDIAGLVAEAIEQVRPSALEPRVTVESSLSPALHDLSRAARGSDGPRTCGLVLHGDSEALLAALVNLLGNALEYGPSGQRVEVVGEVVERAGRWGEGGLPWDKGRPLLVLSVCDRGRTLPAGERRRLGQPFFRGSAARRGRGGGGPRQGTGLGLAVVRQVARQHGGEVELGVPLGGGRGNRFSLLLPLTAARPPGRGSTDARGVAGELGTVSDA